MKVRNCGKTDLTLSEIGFGTAPIGNLFNTMKDEDAIAVIQKAYDLGIRYFDTSSQYGHGLAEIRLGQALREYKREDFIISTKVGDLLRAKANVLPPDNKFLKKLPFFLEYDYTYDGIMRSFEDALQRLGFNTVDILYVHDLDPYIHSSTLFLRHFEDFKKSGYKALRILRDTRVVKAIGFGVRSADVCLSAMEFGDYDCFMLQGGYTLLEQNALERLIPKCQERGITINIAGAFCSGILANGSKKGGHFHYKQAKKDILDKVEKIEKFGKKHDVSLRTMAIHFPLLQEAISSVVIGCQKIEHLCQNIEHYNSKVPSLLWQDLRRSQLTI